MDCVSFGGSANKFVGKTVKAAKINGGKHLEFEKCSPLYRERGITDMWCYTQPKTGDPMMYLEDKKGNLIREFNLKNQLEQVRTYFNRANANRNKAMTLEQQYKKLDAQCEEFDKLITTRLIGRDDFVYTVNGKEFCNKSEAINEALRLKPEFKELVEQRKELVNTISCLPPNINYYY